MDDEIEPVWQGVESDDPEDESDDPEDEDG